MTTPWLHVSPLSNAEGDSGWIVLASRSHPFFAQVISRDVPYTFLRVLPHLDGWWVDDRAREYLFQVIAATTHVSHLCGRCAHDGVPCDAACVMAAARGQAAERAAAMFERMQQYGSDPWPSQFDRRQNEPPPTRRRIPGSSYGSARSQFFPPPAPRIDPAIAAAKLLGVRWPGATKNEVQKAFRVAIMRAHPDLGGTDAQTIAVTNARKILLAVAA